ncbi:hypothetical protein BPT24_207 [Tenacibaculum phage pT24]|uniref:Uncharacterized protein n=1 Tax=Tenacibaculum phage pT24 TaxID=1880590 RepID=A0A1B4XWZ6_9CAUD|nr:hypothetical protein HYP10_gp207 [Tenacibaculum phage pT24]BAV39331.1 hypothetical protein BPT24_207 [Tenacibaculum phage pT24]
MKSILEYVTESRNKTVKADLGHSNMGGWDSIYNKSKMENGDYQYVALISPTTGEINWRGVFKDTEGKNLDKASYDYIMKVSNKYAKKNKNLKKVEKRVKDIFKAKKPVKVQYPEGKVKDAVIDNGRLVFIENGIGLFSHSINDVIELVAKKSYDIVESVNESKETDFVVGQPFMYGNFATTVVSVTETTVELDADGEIFEAKIEDLF